MAQRVYLVQGPLRGVMFRYLNVYVPQQGASLGLHNQLENTCMQFCAHIEL